MLIIISLICTGSFRFLIIQCFFISLTTPKVPTEIVISVVSCGMRLQETLNMLKSALMFNVDKIALKFIIVTEITSIASFTEKVGFV